MGEKCAKKDGASKRLIHYKYPINMAVGQNPGTPGEHQNSW